MQDLTLVGPSTDGTRLILRSAAGVEFSVPIDDPLVAAVQAAHGSSQDDPPARLEVQMDGPLRPRDIQSRIRAGESPEDLAAAAGVDIERVLVFARPVLAERAHIAERAQRASLRRPHGDTGTRLLGDVVSDHLREENLSPDSVSWDAWRREDGRWALTADWTGSDSAEFIFDAAGRYVVAQNDPARWLVQDLPDEPPEAPAAPEAPPARASETRTAPQRPRLVAAEPELPLGEDALDLVNDTYPADDWMATQATARAETSATEESEPAQDLGDESDREETEELPSERKPRRHRASVPSWDEIMFGSGPQE
jgi:hypothetical protein